MFYLRPSAERGPSRFDWLDSKHTFSFGRYYDPNFMGYADLRVINEDVIAAGGGFPTHPHDNMEIVTYIIDGELSHEDSMGNGSVIKPGDIQRMSAGSGITHSEFNASNENPVHLLQIWFLPEKMNITPSYEQKSFSKESKKENFKLVLSPDGENGSVSINQNLKMYVGIFEDASKTHTYSLKKDRCVWIQMVRGTLSVNGHKMHAGDGAAVEAENELVFEKANNAEVILFDMNINN